MHFGIHKFLTPKPLSRSRRYFADVFRTFKARNCQTFIKFESLTNFENWIWKFWKCLDVRSVYKNAYLLNAKRLTVQMFWGNWGHCRFRPVQIRLSSTNAFWINEFLKMELGTKAVLPISAFLPAAKLQHSEQWASDHSFWYMDSFLGSTGDLRTTFAKRPKPVWAS